MAVGAYYNEHGPFAAAWLRELIAEGLIAPGEVDERSIEDVRPDELAGFVQCHFFAGIGVWSLALREAGWPDDRPVWTGSCPCQPFSAAGKGNGFDDERHLWPAFHWLVEQSNPPIVLGEQVASKDGLAWLDLVSSDLEAAGYAFGAVDTCAAGFGSPHIRQRLYWMADAKRGGRQQLALERPTEVVAGESGKVVLLEPRDHRASHGRLAYANDEGLSFGSRTADGRGALRDQGQASAARGLHDWLADSDGGNTGTERQQRSGEQRQQPQDGSAGGVADALRCRTGHAPGRRMGEETAPDRSDWHLPRERLRPRIEGADDRPSPLNGLWRDADWLCCTDGKWRPVAPGTFPLAPAGTVRNRVGLLRGAGNAINLAQAQGFIEAVLAIAIEAASAAETVQLGSVHESAGRQASPNLNRSCGGKE